jgi:hypothetical protein
LAGGFHNRFGQRNNFAFVFDRQQFLVAPERRGPVEKLRFRNNAPHRFQVISNPKRTVADLAKIVNQVCIVFLTAIGAFQMADETHGIIEPFPNAVESVQATAMARGPFPSKHRS